MSEEKWLTQYQLLKMSGRELRRVVDDPNGEPMNRLLATEEIQRRKTKRESIRHIDATPRPKEVE